jgi:uncharacterized DUF497 family protein
MYIGYPLEISYYVESKIYSKHGVSINEVESAIRTRDIYVRKGRGKDLYEVLTYSSHGKYLFIVLRKMTGTRYKLVTARPMTRNERRYYENKRR